MRCFFEKHEIPYNLRSGSVVKLTGSNTTKYGINQLSEKTFQKLPEIKRRLRKHLIVVHVIFSIIGYNTNPNNCLLNSYIVIRVKLRFTIFTWIGLVNKL